MPISPSLGRERRGGGGGGRGVPPRWTVAGVLVLVLIVALGLLGALGDDEPEQKARQPASTPRTTPRTTTTPRRAPVAPTRASLRLVATGEIYVCLVDQRGRVLIPGTTYSAGDQVPVQRARSMRLTLGNNQVQMRVNGQFVAVPASATAIAYELTPEGARTLPEDQAPTCTA